MRKIVWLGENRPLEVQIKELERIFLDRFSEPIEVIHNKNTWRGAEELVNYLDSVKADDFVAVLPLSIIERLCAAGKRPLYAQMEVVRSSQAYDLNYSGRYYRFLGFKRIEKVEMIFSDYLF